MNRKNKVLVIAILLLASVVLTDQYYVKVYRSTILDTNLHKGHDVA